MRVTRSEKAKPGELTPTLPLTPKTRTTRTSLRARNSSPQAKINSDPESKSSKDENSNQYEQESNSKSKKVNRKSNGSGSTTTAGASSPRKSEEIAEAISCSSDQTPASPRSANDGITSSGVSSEPPAVVEMKSGSDVDPISAKEGTGNWQQVQANSAESRTNANDEVNAKLAREKLRASNDHLVRKLFHSLPSNCKKAENAALDFIAGEVHHPVISCFRDLMNFNDLAAIFRRNGKKRLRSFEFGLIAVGMLDSIAMTLYNPLYQESFDCLWNRKVSQKVEKILQKLKSLLICWGTSEKSSDREQYDSVMKYLKRLVPRFHPINFSESFESTLTNIKEDVQQTIANRQDLRLKTQSFFNAKDVEIITEPETKSSPSTSTPPSSRSLSNSTTISNDSEISIPTSDEENEWKMTSVTSISSSSEFPLPRKKRRSKVLISSGVSNAGNAPKAPEADEEVVLLNVTEKPSEVKEPPPKKVKLELGGPSGLSDPDQPKPKVNAFALMMNRSRQLAEMAKQKQDKNRQNGNQLATIATSKIKPKCTAT